MKKRDTKSFTLLCRCRHRRRCSLAARVKDRFPPDTKCFTFESSTSKALVSASVSESSLQAEDLIESHRGDLFG